MPLQLTTVREQPGTGYGGAAQLVLVGREVLHLDHPTEPTAAGFGTCADGLTERRLVCGGVLENLDHFHVLVPGERQDHVSRTEARVNAALDRLDP